MLVLSSANEETQLQVFCMDGLEPLKRGLFAISFQKQKNRSLDRSENVFSYTTKLQLDLDATISDTREAAAAAATACSGQRKYSSL